MIPPYCFVLIHSPLVGPLTWLPVSERLRARGIDSWVPQLDEGRDPSTPYWRRHAGSVAEFIQARHLNAPVILTAHSGAGPLLPAIRTLARTAVAAYLFVDAGVPVNDRSRSDLMAMESPEWAGQLRQFLEAGGRFPDWSDAQLREVVPDDELRQRLLRELRPRGLDFFTEPIPVFQGWPDAPCGYIRFSQAYDRPYAEAMRQGWAAAQKAAGHFHMLVEPQQVVEMMLEVVSRL